MGRILATTNYFGEVAEWSNAAVSKTVVPSGTVSSNLTLSASLHHMPVIIETDRLLLRTWKDEDRVPFAQMNADPEVRKYFPKLLTREESDEFVNSIIQTYNERGYCYYASELKSTSEFIGFIGFGYAEFPAPFTPCTEIGWRLMQPYWNVGLATEGAFASLNYGFQTLGLEDILAWTAVPNTPSQRVMEKIGMSFWQNFDHPRIPEGHWLRQHVLYRKRK